MIVLDTNVLSELMKPSPSPPVPSWVRAQAQRELFTTVISEAELWYGVEMKPPGKRRDELALWADLTIKDLNGRVLPFDRQAARAYGRILARRRSQGRPMKELDAQIAAIALCHDALLATRNVRDFEGCGVRLFNPWEA